MSSRHIAFGLRWLSDIPLSDFPIAHDDDPPDVELRVRSWPEDLECGDAVLWYTSPAPDSTLRVFRLSEGQFFFIQYIDGTEFVIDRCGSQIWCRWDPVFPFDYAATYLYGPILGFLLRLRGVVCLHASVVGIDDWAVGFAGSAGAGKSTIAAALAGYRFPVLSDDVLPLMESESGIEAVPAYPRLRLWPDSVDALLGSREALPRITESWEKRHLDLTAENYRFETRRRPLGAIYILGERSDDCSGPRIRPLAGARGLQYLIGNTYASRLFDDEMRSREFRMLSRLMGQVPLRTITPFADLNLLGELCAPRVG